MIYHEVNNVELLDYKITPAFKISITSSGPSPTTIATTKVRKDFIVLKFIHAYKISES